MEGKRSKTTNAGGRSGRVQARLPGLAGNPITTQSANCRDIGHRALYDRSRQTLSRDAGRISQKRQEFHKSWQEFQANLCRCCLKLASRTLI
jgi:hypothetical protein